MSGEYYIRQGSVTIGEREFKSPPFTFNFDIDLKSGFSPAKVSLFNPSRETIDSVAEKTATIVRINAGYKGDVGPVYTGTITSHEVEYSRPDRILKLNAAENANIWYAAEVNKTYKLQPVSSIIRDMCSQVGISFEKIRPKDDKVLESFTATTFRTALVELVRRSGSRYYFRSGALVVEDPADAGSRSVYVLTYETGLLAAPEKTKNGWKAKAVFLWRIQNGSIVDIRWRENGAQKTMLLKVTAGRLAFDTAGQGLTEMEGAKVG